MGVMTARQDAFRMLTVMAKSFIPFKRQCCRPCVGGLFGVFLACAAPLVLAQGAGGGGLSVLAPAVPMPVEIATPLSPPVPLDSVECPASADTTVQPNTEDVAGADDAATALPPGDTPCAAPPQMPQDDGTTYDFSLGEIVRHVGGPVMIMSGISSAPAPLFSSLKSLEGGSFQDGSYIYRQSNGPTMAVGNVSTKAPAWASSAEIGGVQVSNWLGNERTIPEGQIGYSSSFGRLNNMGSVPTSGAVDYGVAAGSGSVRYGVTPDLTLETQMQTARSLTARGLGTTYSAGTYGTFQVGATQSSFDAVNAWRYRFGYQVDLGDSVSVGVNNEQIGSGFSDLSAYRDGANSANRSRSTLSVGVPTHGMGTFTGTYSGMRENSSVSERRLGLKHSMAVAPEVNVSVGGNRDIVTGEYEMRANVSMPFQSLFGSGWGH